MALAWAASASVSNNTGVATTGALSVTTVAGQLMVVGVADDSATTTTQGIPTDNMGNTYTRIGSILTNSVSLGLYYSVLTTGGSGHTVTDTWSTAASARCTVIAQYFNGFTGTPTLDKSVSSTGTGTSASPGTTATTTAANELVVMSAAHAGNISAFSAGTGFSNLRDVSAANAENGMSSKVVSSIGTQTGAMPIVASRAWAAFLATFYDAVATPPANTTNFFAFM